MGVSVTLALARLKGHCDCFQFDFVIPLSDSIFRMEV